MITGATTALEACHMFAEKVRMERFQNNFQLKEVTPSVRTTLFLYSLSLSYAPLRATRET
jgi:hypothetical protein